MHELFAFLTHISQLEI